MKKTPIRKTFGQQLRQIRIEKGFSQESLAAAAGLHRTYIGAIERGEQSISVDNIQKIAKALNIKMADVFKNLP